MVLLTLFGPEKSYVFFFTAVLILQMENNIKTQYPAKRIPKVSFNGGNTKIIAGTYQGIKGPGKPHTDMFYHDIYLEPNIDFEIFIENGWNAFIYV